MKIKHYITSLTLILTFNLHNLSAQEESKSWWDSNTEFSGYIKYLNTTTIASLDNILSDNLLHNRLNLTMFLNDNLDFDFQVRNRAIWGESIKHIPSYKSTIASNNKEIRLSSFIVDQEAFLLHSEIDRLNIKYSTKKWDFIFGRQRVNWGKNLVWNPNDLFNAYNFIDFDYEERPGTDAINIQYNSDNGSIIQTVYSYGKDVNSSILALRYQFNHSDYDIQLITANYNTDIMLGAGWEGYIKNAGFKGEISYFNPKSEEAKNNSTLTASLSADYFFKNGMSTFIGVLYGSNGVDSISSVDLNGLTSNQLSPKMLMPNKWSYFAQLNYTLSGSMRGNTAIIYAHGLNAVFLMPSINYEIQENWDLDFVAQIFTGVKTKSVSNLGNIVILRLRYSY